MNRRARMLVGRFDAAVVAIGFVLAGCAVTVSDPPPDLIELTSPDGSMVSVNPATIVNLRQAPAVRRGQFTASATCAIYTTDGKFVAVVEDCAQVRRLIRQQR